MASRDFASLQGPFAEKARRFVAEYEKLLVENDLTDVSLLVYCCRRSFEEQARIYRQSRSVRMIETKAATLRGRGFPFLASILMDVGPQYGELGKHVTFGGPGESWHNYGLAIDVVPLVGGKPMWNPLRRADGGKAYVTTPWALIGEAASALNLTWGGTWSWKDWPHVQGLTTSNPLSFYRPDEVASILAMREEIHA